MQPFTIETPWFEQFRFYCLTIQGKRKGGRFCGFVFVIQLTNYEELGWVRFYNYNG